jgi:hypothetical protein
MGPIMKSVVMLWMIGMSGKHFRVLQEGRWALALLVESLRDTSGHSVCKPCLSQDGSNSGGYLLKWLRILRRTSA